MAQYIDRNLIEWYGCDFEDDSCKNRECSGCSHAECSHSQVMQIPTADVVECKKIDKAIEEMNKLASHKVKPISFDQAVAIDMCIEILNRNIGESK